MAGLISSSPSSHLFLQQLLRPPSKLPSVPSSFHSLTVLTTRASVRHYAPLIPINTLHFTSSLVSSPPCLSSASSLHRPPPNLPIRGLSTSELTAEADIEDEIDSDGDEEVEFESESEDSESDKVGDGVEIEQPSEKISGSSAAKAVESATKLPLPNLSIKEKKELASYAHSLGKELRSQQIGKSGVTDAVATALIETLEKRELLKVKIHNNSPGELEDEVKVLEKLTGSVVVSQIGRTVILYRPSLAKLKAEEKKKQNQIIFAKKQQAFKSQFQNRGLSRPTGYGGRGGSSNRFSSSRGGSRSFSSRGDRGSSSPQ